MKPAAYREIVNAEIAEQELSGGGLLRVIAGNVSLSQPPLLKTILNGPMPEMSTEPVLVDVKLAPGETIELSFGEKNPAWVYVYSGATDEIQSCNLGVYQKGDGLHLSAGASGAELLVLSGKPMDEPVVQYGPFVMNSMEEIELALIDFQSPDFIKNLKLRRVGA